MHNTILQKVKEKKKLNRKLKLNSVSRPPPLFKCNPPFKKGGQGFQTMSMNANWLIHPPVLSL